MLVLHQEQQRRLHEKLRRELGPAVLAALEDPDITEVMLNPDGCLWVESQRAGMRDTGKQMSAMQAENLIGTVAAMLEMDNLVSDCCRRRNADQLLVPL